MSYISSDNLASTVLQTINDHPITDIHTHLFAPEFGDLLLYGIDELLTYHYLIAETMRYSTMEYDAFFKLSKSEQANLIWQTLFVENSPISEACRGVLTTLHALGVDTTERNLDKIRAQIDTNDVNVYIQRILKSANVRSVVMTNDPFDPSEREVWLKGYKPAEPFYSALRIDPLILNWPTAHLNLQKWGYQVEEDLTPQTLSEARRFVEDWVDLMNPLYVAVSLPDTFQFPAQTLTNRLIEECILPVCRNRNLPFALMIGVKRQVNPALRSAGDSLGKADPASVEYLCANFPHNKFMVTMLSRENQHELAVIARKFRNLLVFGCWWFLNNPSLIDEITRMRLELLGVSVIPQHSDARILDQLAYKWTHSKKIIGQILVEKYQDLLDTGWNLTSEDIQRDVAKLFGGNFWEFLERKF
ncbi:MAG: hypothetical protein JWN30_945 [Bacilli bacterium]|nr:hypothetical protein [Bacilli bacterium]